MDFTMMFILLDSTMFCPDEDKVRLYIITTYC